MSGERWRLKDKKIFVLDMDGTFYLGDKIIEGSLNFIEKLRETGKDFMFFTNNSSKTSEYYIKKLAAMGCEIESSQIATSADVTINYLKKFYKDKSIYFAGTRDVERYFEDNGIRLVQNCADAVVISFDTSITYEKISKACTFIRNGSDFIATHMDLNCPTETGFIPDCGAMCALITAATGVKPKYIGKPFKETLDFILDKTGLSLKDIVFVGDRLYTDIATAYNYGATGLLVLSGETKADDLEKSEIIPDFIFPSLGKVAEVL